MEFGALTLYSEAELLAVTGFMAGSELSLTELRMMAVKIADYYHQNGYFVAQAYLPAQEIKHGVVSIAVIEGRYDQIVLRNQSNLSDALANNLLHGLQSGDVIAAAPFERHLLLLSDTPGVHVKSTLIPGSAVGTSDLIVDVTPGRLVTGSIAADNEGNRYSGAYRLGVTVNINNPFGHGDALSVWALTSQAGLRYGRIAYQTQLGMTKVGVSYAGLRYRLGKEFADLQARGTAEIASLYGSHPLIRTRNGNLYAQVQLSAKTFQDRMDSISTVTDKRARVGQINLNGDRRDGIGGGGLNSFSLTGTFGRIDIRSPAALATDAATARSNGDYAKLEFDMMRLQNVTQSISLYAAFTGQLASKNLDVSETMELGGANAVRAYPAGEGYADQGYVLNLEVRLLLQKLSEHVPGQVQLIGFVDTGTALKINKHTWATGENSRTLSGTGVGLVWGDKSNFVLKTYYARKLGSEVATSAPDARGRFWIQCVKFF